MPGRGIPYSLNEAKSVVDDQTHVIDPYHRELIQWLVGEVERCQKPSTDNLRDLVKRTCHTPLLVAGQFVALTETDRGPHLRSALATEAEMLLALEHEIFTLKTANAYLRTQVPSGAGKR